jgi:hypothetical protein
MSSQTAGAGGRTLTLHVTPGQEGHVLSVWTNGAPVLDAVIDNRPIRTDPSPRAVDDTAWSADFLNAPAGGSTIALTLKGLQPITVVVLDRAAGLPEIPGQTFTARPPAIVPIQTGDQTLVRRTYSF